MLHVTCQHSTRTSLTGLEGFPCLYILYCIICRSGKLLISIHFLSACLLLLRIESVVALRPSYLHSVPGCTTSPHISLPSSFRFYRLAEEAPRCHRSVRPLRYQPRRPHIVRPAPSTGPILNLATAISARTLGLRSAAQKNCAKAMERQPSAPPTQPS
jgi:hypothetical protein